MPQATTKLRSLMYEWFGDDVSDTGPIAFLRSHGFSFDRTWAWHLPVHHHTVSCYEAACISFLMQEWDWRGIHEHYDPSYNICLCHKVDESVPIELRRPCYA